uniref:Uncharacterized protein n=1 Tax=Arundo donax TaxID=35708 RepID=A0A0A8YVD1_ARUDO
MYDYSEKWGHLYSTSYLWKLSRGLYKKQVVCKCNQAK